MSIEHILDYIKHVAHALELAQMRLVTHKYCPSVGQVSDEDCVLLRTYIDGPWIPTTGKRLREVWPKDKSEMRWMWAPLGWDS